MGHKDCGQRAMYKDSFDTSLTQGEIEVMLDGLPVGMPPGRRTLVAIRSYLEMLAMENQRILCSFTVDGELTNPNEFRALRKTFKRVEAETLDLDDLPLQIIGTALQQTIAARKRVESAITQVLINEGTMARECWWDLAQVLKAPLLTLSLLPETICGPANGGASLVQLRKWQLQQLARIIKGVDAACWSEDSAVLSNALETEVFPWLGELIKFISLWQETAAAGSRSRANWQHAA